MRQRSLQNGKVAARGSTALRQIGHFQRTGIQLDVLRRGPRSGDVENREGIRGRGGGALDFLADIEEFADQVVVVGFGDGPKSLM